jgi:SAM-dependent methyltransferase
MPDSLARNELIRGKISEIELNYLHLRPGSRVLDVGCARGYTLVELAQKGCIPYGVEILPDLVAQALTNLAKTGARGYPIVGLAGKLPFADKTFEAVICTEVIEHVPIAEEVLSEIHRVLKPGGRLCLSVPTWFTERLFSRLDPNFATYSGHVRVFRQGEMRHLLIRHGFIIEVVKGKYFEWSVYWLFRALLLKTEPVFYEHARRYERLDYYYKRAWQLADRLWIGRALKSVGNHLFPKSHYYYCRIM